MLSAGTKQSFRSAVTSGKRRAMVRRLATPDQQLERIYHYHRVSSTSSSAVVRPFTVRFQHGSTWSLDSSRHVPSPPVSNPIVGASSVALDHHHFLERRTHRSGATIRRGNAMATSTTESNATFFQGHFTVNPLLNGRMMTSLQSSRFFESNTPTLQTNRNHSTISGPGLNNSIFLSVVDSSDTDQNDRRSREVNILHRRRRPYLSHGSLDVPTRACMSTGPNGSSSSSSSRTAGSFSTQAKIPTPSSSPTSSSSSSLSSMIDPKALAKSAMSMTWTVTKIVVSFLLRLPYNTWFYLTHSQERKDKITEIKEMAKKEFDHYWMGTKLLMADVRTAQSLLGKTLRGSTLTRRERKQLLRTVSDLFRLVPFSMFILIPLMEFVLPFALRLFPNMLPSTFQDSLKHEENMKRELQSRIAMAQFFQETMEELAKQQKQIAANRKDGNDEPADSIASQQEACAADMLEFLDRARKGEPIPPDVIIQYAHYFQDDLTLDNMPRMQLINQAKYMGIPPYGSDSFLRFQLRHRIRMLKEDDQRILWEGINSLTKMELREACQERGMRSTGLSKEAYKRSLQQWLDLSVNKNVPISLLIMSRVFFLQKELTTPATTDETQSVAGLADAISGMDKDVLNDVILNVATSEERKSDPDVRKIQLEVLTQQNERIKEEQEEREAAARKKEWADKAADQVAATDGGKEANVHSDAETVVVREDIDKMTEKELSDAIDRKVKEVKEELVEKAAGAELGERELTPEEMEAISQLLSADPVLKEREDLARIKKAIKDRIEERVPVAKSDAEESSTATSSDGSHVVDDGTAAAVINKMEDKAAEEAEKATAFFVEGQATEAVSASASADVVEEIDEAVEDEAEDPVVARLKKRIESMVDKIEGQLSDVHVKIGDKLHYLDKDMDGILSREEMAEVLCQVLKNISPEEALEIADEMDENKDGVFTVEELITWIETNKLVKYESLGRDAEMDKIMESHTTEKEEAGNEENPRQKEQA